MEVMEGKEAFKFIKNNRDKAFNDIVIEFSDRIYSLAKLYTKDEHLSQDITQDTLIKIYKYLDSFSGDSSIYTWIYRITINTCKNSVIRENKHKVVEDICFIKEEGYEDKLIEDFQAGYLLEALGNIKKSIDQFYIFIIMKI